MGRQTGWFAGVQPHDARRTVWRPRDLGRLADAGKILREVRAADRSNHFAGITLAAVLMDRAEHQGDRSGLGEARQLLGAAWAAGIRDGVIKAAYGRLKSLE